MAGVPDHLGSNGTGGRVRTTTGEEPSFGLQSAPVLAQGFQQNGTEHDVPILAALAALDVYDHPLTINVANLQAGQFGAARSGSVEGHQQNAVEGSGRGVDEPSDFLLAQHRGQVPRLLGIGRLRHAPAPLQSLNEEEAQGGQPLGNAARSQLSLAEQIGLVLADVLRTQAVRRAVEVAAGTGCVLVACPLPSATAAFSANTASG